MVFIQQISLYKLDILKRLYFFCKSCWGKILQGRASFSHH